MHINKPYQLLLMASFFMTPPSGGRSAEYKKMLNNLAILLLTMLASVLSIAATSAHADSTPSPEQVVAELQKLPHHAMFCDDELGGGGSTDGAPIDLEEIYKKYFSKEFYKLFMWTECKDPDFPPHHGSALKSDFVYDIRNAMAYDQLGGHYDTKLKNYSFKIIKYQGKNKAIVGMHYSLGRTPMFARYTLIREGGQWKIDDIAPQGDYVDEDRQQDSTDHSDSVKTDMQNFYRAAEVRYQIDHPGPDLESLKQMMDTFRKLPYYELFCKDEKWKPLEPTKFRSKLEPYLSKEFYKLFLWYQCGEPAAPPRYKDIAGEIPWDIRYGVKYMPDTGAALFIVKQAEEETGARVFSIVELKNQGPDKAIYTLQFWIRKLDGKSGQGARTTFRLIRDDGQWKVDDIVLGGGHKLDADRQKDIARTDSIKADMQNRYHAAEERYQQEQAKKGAVPKP